MADLGSFEFISGSRRADRKRGINEDYLFYSVAGNNVEWNQCSLVIPDNILDAWCTLVAVYTSASVTVHEVDPTSLRECFIAQVFQRGDAGVRQAEVSEPIMGMSDSTAAGAATGWASMLRWRHHVTRDDIVRLRLPPADDGASPTGDYNVFLTLEVEKYTKR